MRLKKKKKHFFPHKEKERENQNFIFMLQFDLSTLRRSCNRVIKTLDTHAAGEPCRIIIGGVGPLPGSTIVEKREYFIEHFDDVRKLILFEPREAPIAVALTEPVTDGALFGVIYMEPHCYLHLCGHATMATVSALSILGTITPTPERPFLVDTPSGPLTVSVHVNDQNKFESVSLVMVPSFVFADSVSVTLEDGTQLEGALVCAGGFFFMAPAEQTGLDVRDPANRERFRQLGVMLRKAVNEQLTVFHPTRPEVKSVDVMEFYSHGSKEGNSLIVYGEGRVDRSPCGTGTAAKMTLLHHRKEMGVGGTYNSFSPLGTKFVGKILEENVRFGGKGDFVGVVTEVTGSGYITGTHEWFQTPEDPFPTGFML